MLGVAGQFVGLDTVSVGTEDLDLVSSDVDPATRLTVSKRLGTKFELVLSENLEENESTWIVIYRPVSGYEFRLSSSENTKEAIEFRQEITFGPGVSTRTRARAAAVVQDKVRSVALAGEPGFSAEQVLAGTKLRQGDRFEFRAWLEDRDRIARFYWDRGYYTARVVPMRTAAESEGKERPVDLQYRIARGRRTVLEVTGYAGGDDLLDRLRQAWSRNVVLDLLDDKLARAVREHLIDAGFLRASIDVEVDRPDADTDRARVRIDPGPRTGSRQLAFRGNEVLATETLQELAASGRLDASAWKDPAPLVAAIREAYAAKGYLAARVTIEPIEFADEAATLPIRIDEGRAAQVAALQLTGAAPERRSGALEAIALAVGSPFAAGADRSARARLERYYRDLGFRNARVETTATAVSQGPDMALTFAVNEGPLQVISSVEIEGVQSTRSSLVGKAVQLTPGEPAGAAAVAATEKRLYELGTFRRAEVRLEPAPAPVQGVLPVKASPSASITSGASTRSRRLDSSSGTVEPPQPGAERDRRGPLAGGEHLVGRGGVQVTVAARAGARHLLGELDLEDRVELVGHGDRRVARPGSNRRLGGQADRAGQPPRAAGDQDLAGRELGRAGEPPRRELEDPIRDQPGRRLRRSSVGDPDRRDANLAAVRLARGDPVAELGRVKRDRQLGVDRRPRDLARRRVDPRGDVAATTGATQVLIAAIASAAGSRGADAKPVPKIASTITPDPSSAAATSRRRAREGRGRSAPDWPRRRGTARRPATAAEPRPVARAGEGASGDQPVAAVVSLAADDANRAGAAASSSPRPPPGRRPPSGRATGRPAPRSPTSRSARIDRRRAGGRASSRAGYPAPARQTRGETTAAAISREWLSETSSASPSARGLGGAAVKDQPRRLRASTDDLDLGEPKPTEPERLHRRLLGRERAARWRPGRGRGLA